MLPSKILDCLHCHSYKTKKHGILADGGQRYKCNDCQHTFSVGGKRGTYDQSFKQGVIENYCHRHHTAADMVAHYGISTRTLIKRSRDHKVNCPNCSV